MRIKFDGHQSFQIDAINAVCDLFRGQPLVSALSSFSIGAATGELFTEMGIANSLAVDEVRILENLRSVQSVNALPLSPTLDGMNFSVEMETGTGKTYVYLRTVYELNARYGFKKFVIIVPSVAVREGVLQSIAATREHFCALFDNVPFEGRMYDSAKLSRVRQFAASNQMQVLVINVDAFNKSSNVINRDQDALSGRRPMDFIKACRPIVIIDEPQNFESEGSRQAIASLSPLCTLRYSATHRKIYNIVYRLDPVRAYDLRIVKRIEVDSVVDEANFNGPYIRVDSIEVARSKITADLTIDVQAAKGPVRKSVRRLKSGSDLFDVSGERDAYSGYVIQHLDAGRGLVEFGNGVTIALGDIQGGSRDDVMREQVRETVREHFEKELDVLSRLPEGRRVKVLSLFFIDRVANYAPADGKIRRWFCDEYVKLSKDIRFSKLTLPPVEKAHGGYFASARGVPLDTSDGSTLNDEAYVLIMSDKARLLSLDEPLRFIFSHSALREGWDNPNVFQICTLNETKSELKKRQEIGRGLRLPVDESGERSSDPSVNKLTLIVNESYESFARALQTEIAEDCSVDFGDRLGNKRERKRARLKKAWRLNADFLELWKRIKHKTRYSVCYDTEELVARSVEAIAVMPQVARAKVVARKSALDFDGSGIVGKLQSIREVELEKDIESLPDVIGYLQRETELTRDTLARILIDSGRLGDLLVDPQEFLDRALREIRSVLHDLMVSGIKYERVADAEYEMFLFQQNELEGYLSRMLDVKKSIFDAIECDSEVERQFAEELDAREDINLFVKLPRWFKIETPVGTYNPDWAIVKEHGGKLYLVRETKGSVEEAKLRGVEWDKIRCGESHFNELDVDFKAVTSAREI